MQKTKALIWLFPENIRRVEKQADSYFFGGWMLRKFQGDPLKPNHVLAFCQASFRMTLSRAGFHMLAPGTLSLSFSGWSFGVQRLSEFTFLPRSKRLLISWLQSPSAVIWEPPQNKVFCRGQHEESHPWQGHGEGSLTKRKDVIKFQGFPQEFPEHVPQKTKICLPLYSAFPLFWYSLENVNSGL